MTFHREEIDGLAEHLLANGGYDPHWPKDIAPGILSRVLDGFGYHLRGLKQLKESFSTTNFWVPKGLFKEQIDEVSEAYRLVHDACEMAEERIRILLEDSKKKKLYAEVFEEAQQDAEELLMERKMGRAS